MGDLRDHFQELLLFPSAFFQTQGGHPFHFLQFHHHLGGERLPVLLVGQRLSLHDLFRVAAELRGKTDKLPAEMKINAQADQAAEQNGCGQSPRHLRPPTHL